MADRPKTGADIDRLRQQAAAIGSGEPLAELSLFVVGARFDNKRRKGKPTGNRRSEILMCEPGEPVKLQHEPHNPMDTNAIMVISVRGVQLGYITADRTSVIHSAVAQGRMVRAIFQEAVPSGAAIRVAFDGRQPTLPVRAVPDVVEQPDVTEAVEWDGVDWIPPDG